MMHVAEKLVFACGGVAHGNAYLSPEVERVVEVVPPVGTSADVGRVKALFALGIVRILRFAVDDSLHAPVRQIVFGRAPTHVVVHAERIAAEPVVTAVYVYPAVKQVRLAVGDVFPRGKIGIEYLFFAHFSSVVISRAYCGTSA